VASIDSQAVSLPDQHAMQACQSKVDRLLCCWSQRLCIEDEKGSIILHIDSEIDRLIISPAQVSQ
jgi:hypothetical protein